MPFLQSRERENAFLGIDETPSLEDTRATLFYTNMAESLGPCQSAQDHALPPRPSQTRVRGDKGKAPEDLGYVCAFTVADVLSERRGEGLLTLFLGGKPRFHWGGRGTMAPL